MHELSIAQSIIDIIYQNVPSEKYSSVQTVNIKIGKFSNILTDSLLFCFNALVKDSPIKDASLIIKDIPVRIKCKNCKSISEIEPPVFICPKCKSNSINIISGMEMQVEDIELKEEILEEK